MSLLEEIKTINHDFIENRKKNGELFNIYSLLNIEHRENETHSVLLEDLLSPKGSHGQGRLFLDLFTETLGENKETFNNQVKIKREHNIGEINEEYTKGGRVDIIIYDDKTTWIIENKLYAKNQPNQLERYRNQFPYAKIIYLTIEDYVKYPNSSIDIHDISYEKEISDWLLKIIENISDKEYLKNSIQQYYNLVQNITFKGFTHKMNMDIQNKITESIDSIEAAFKIKEQYNKAIDQLYLSEFKFVKDTFPKEDYRILKSDSDYHFYFTKDIWQENNLAIGIEFENYKNLSNLFIGIYKIDSNKKIQESFVEQLNNRSNNSIKENGINWLLYHYPFQRNSIYYLDVAKEIKDGKFKSKLIADMTEYVVILENIIKLK